MKCRANSVTGCVCRARHRSIRETGPDHQVAVIQRIGDECPRFIGHQALRAAQVVKERGHLLEISRTLVIDDRDATQIEAIISR